MQTVSINLYLEISQRLSGILFYRQTIFKSTNLFSAISAYIQAHKMFCIFYRRQIDINVDLHTHSLKFDAVSL